MQISHWDVLRLVVVTPGMHKVHHFPRIDETNSNYSTLFSFWGRLFRSFRTREDLNTISLGLDEFDDRSWQTVSGMLKTPLRD